MQEEEEWQFLSNEGQIIKFNKKLEEFVSILADKNIDEPMPVAINKNTLVVIKQFIEAHNYDKTTIKIKKPIISGKPQDNIDQASFQILELKQNQELFDTILQASYYLDFPLLKQACLVILAMSIYIGDELGDLEKTRTKYGLGDLTPQEELQILQNNQSVFEELQKSVKEELMVHEQKFTLIKQQQQQQQQQ